MAAGTVTIQVADVNRIFNAIADEAPIPTDAGGVPLYTKAVWGKMWLDNLLTKKVSRYETKLAQVAAVVADDPNLIIVT